MTPTETALILLILTDIVASFYLAKASATVIQARINLLDQWLKQQLEELPLDLGQGQELNPFHMLILQMIQEKMKTPALNVTEVIPRGKDGKFT